MITVSFKGPYSWYRQDDIASVFDPPDTEGVGIYLWAIPQKQGEVVYYVGETGRSFGERMLEHLKEHLSGFYHLYEPEAFYDGRKVIVWPGRYDRSQPKTIEAIIDAHSVVAPTAESMARAYRFYLAEIDRDQRVRKRIESAIADYMRLERGSVPNYQDYGIRYDRRNQEEAPIKCRVSCPDTLRGMPVELEI